MAEADNYARREEAFFRFSLLYLFLHFGAFLVEAALQSASASGAGRWRSAPTTRCTSGGFGRNLGLGLTLAGLRRAGLRADGGQGDSGSARSQGYDHVVQPATCAARRRRNEAVPAAAGHEPDGGPAGGRGGGDGCRCPSPPCRSTTGSARSPALAARPAVADGRAGRDPGPDGDGALRRLARARDAVGVHARSQRDDDAAHRRDRAGLLRGLQPDRPGRWRARPATTSRPMRRAAISPRSTVSASTEQVLQPGERVQMPVTFYRRSRRWSTDPEGAVRARRSRCPTLSTTEPCPTSRRRLPRLPAAPVN